MNRTLVKVLTTMFLAIALAQLKVIAEESSTTTVDRVTIEITTSGDYDDLKAVATNNNPFDVEITCPIVYTTLIDREVREKNFEFRGSVKANKKEFLVGTIMGNRNKFERFETVMVKQQK